ncbi:hypothetical protein SEA_LILBEANIE_75 [Gordonia phage Lilbeanie]|uniref:Uncharacterized protein n=1 Tax=Gordonia phage Lilbeanie TaxID=2794947 RepID=A0A7T1KSD3_9CAUD|nr:hypothetical protein J1773_gp75 [Gordonia phage Lilbeanie]QPO17153.1 hypothetical protein SEA_LILBEANIE_75 [Gordonia phage Lilbeanie]
MTAVARKPHWKPIDPVLPKGWTPEYLDRFDRLDYDHLIGYGCTPEEALRRMGKSVDAVGKSWRFHQKQEHTA